MKKKMNILCASDRNFLYPTYTFMASVMENHKGIEINFYMLAGEDVTDADKLKLKKFINSYKCNLEFLNIDSNLFNNYVLHEKFPRSAYYRLMAHKYLPQDMDRILYLDVDIIIAKNIYDDLYKMDFEDKYMVVATQTPPSTYLYPSLSSIAFVKIGKADVARSRFFISGMLLSSLRRKRCE